MDHDNHDHGRFGDAAPETTTPETTTPDFAQLGNGQIAYVKPVTVEGAEAFAVHSADGRALAVVASRDVAFALIVQNDMEPVSVH